MATGGKLCQNQQLYSGIFVQIISNVSVYFQDGCWFSGVEMVAPAASPEGDAKVNYVLRGGTDTFFLNSGIACMFHFVDE